MTDYPAIQFRHQREGEGLGRAQRRRRLPGQVNWMVRLFSFLVFFFLFFKYDF